MSISIRDKTVIFDYGEVISLTPSEADRQALVSLSGADPELFWEAYWDRRNDLDQGLITPDQYWNEIGSAVGALWQPTLIHQLWSSDFRSWLTLNPETLQVLHELKTGGTRMALLSNAGTDFSSFFRHGSLGALFDRVVVSGELKIVKPDAAIFTHALRELDISAEQAIFIDNRTENVLGAQQVGLSGHIFTSVDKLRKYLLTFSS